MTTLYGYFANFSRNVGHIIVDYSIPRSDAIALVTGGAGWFARRYTLTYGTGFLAGIFSSGIENQQQAYCDNRVCNWFFRFTGHVAPITFAPEAATESANYMAIAASFVTSVSLNILSTLIWGPLEGTQKKEDELKLKAYEKSNSPPKHLAIEYV